MLSLVYNEVFKVLARKRLLYFALIIVGVNLLPWFESVMGTVDIPINGQNVALYMLRTYAGLLLPIFIMIMVGDLITEEYANGTLKLSLLHPVSRARLLTAKALALSVPILILLAFAMTVSYLIATVIFGWGDSFSYNDLTCSTGAGVLLTLKSYLVTLLPLWSFGLMLGLLALLFTSNGAFVGVAMGILILLSFIAQAAPGFRPYLIVEHLTFFELLINGDLPKVALALLMMAVYGPGAYLFGMRIFKKRDLVY